MPDPRVSALCQEFSIEIVPPHKYPEIGQTRATETIARIIRKHGEGHARLVLSFLAETANNKALIDETGLWCMSDMVRASAPILRRPEGASELAETFDAMPLGPLQAMAQELSGRVPVRYALDGMVWERIVRRFGKDADQLDLLDDRRGAG
jgi:hypothetical protein